MKELSIEEKARRYDEALATTRKLYNMRGDWTNLEIESIFPELKESEGKDIKQFLIDFIKVCGWTEKKDQGWPSKEKCIAWLEKQGEQKPADKIELMPTWSEEDERNFDVIYGIIYNSCNAEDASRLLTWFKAIKDRVQPKQEWSNWDKTIIESIEALCDEKIESVVFQDVKEHVNDIKDWLKSLRPQNWTKEDKERYISCLQRLSTGNPEQPETINSKWFKEHVYPQNRWKPSDEQMNTLEYYMHTLICTKHKEILFGLYADLKKLREE